MKGLAQGAGVEPTVVRLHLEVASPLKILAICRFISAQGIYLAYTYTYLHQDVYLSRFLKDWLQYLPEKVIEILCEFLLRFKLAYMYH